MREHAWLDSGLARCSRTRLSVLRSRAQLFPHIAALGPFGVVDTRNLQFFLREGAMPVGADVFDPRPANKQQTAPPNVPNRHAQPPQANKEALSMILFAQREHAHREQKPDAN